MKIIIYFTESSDKFYSILCYRLPGEPLGNVHFAGTEVALTQHGYMDGALRTAQRAAQEVGQYASI